MIKQLLDNEFAANVNVCNTSAHDILLEAGYDNISSISDTVYPPGNSQNNPIVMFLSVIYMLQYVTLIPAVVKIVIQSMISLWFCPFSWMVTFGDYFIYAVNFASFVNWYQYFVAILSILNRLKNGDLIVVGQILIFIIGSGILFAVNHYCNALPDTTAENFCFGIVGTAFFCLKAMLCVL